MPDSRDSFSAGERLSPTRRDPPRQPPRKPSAPRGTGRGPQKPSLFSRIIRFFVTSLYRVVFLGAVAAIIIGAGAFLVFSAGLPSIEALKTYTPPLESRVYSDDFHLVSELGGQHCVYVPYDQIPPLVAQAFISAEDRLFWVEPGINPLAMMRAGLTDIARMGSGRRPQGASTITEQVVKNMLLDNHITFGTKIKEVLLAMRVSQAMSKQQVITLYLNEVDLGHNTFGIAAAAQTYFNKPLSQLDIAQAATLAALPKAPTNYDPFLHPQDALTRRNFIIGRMLADGAISQAQADAATAEPLLPHAGATSPATTSGDGYFADAVKSDLTQRFGADAVGQGGLIVHTSLDQTLQSAATEAVRNGLERYDRIYGGWHGLVAHIDDASLAADWQADLAKQATPPGMRHNWRLGIVLDAGDSAARIGFIDPLSNAAKTGTLPLQNMRWTHAGAVAGILHPGDIIMISGGNTLSLEQIPKIQGALISMDPRTGRVLAMVGGWSHDISPFNRVTQAQRQPGSSVKPLVYLTAMEQGVQPDAPVLDAPFVQQMSDGTTYRPGNYEDSFQGPVPVFHALEQSLNLATLHLARQIGLDNIANTFQSFGIIDQMPPYYPSAIGAIDTTLWKMATAYATLDEYGRQVQPTLIDSVTGPDGKVLYQAQNQNCDNCMNGDPTQPPIIDYSGAQLADPDSVFQMLTMMKGVVLRGTGTPAVAGISQPVAGKTGTTNNFNDAWFIGFTPGVLTGCWIGFDTPASLGKDQTGGNVCGPIWNEYMKVALANQPDMDFPAPAGMTLQQVPEPDGTMVTEAFKPGQTPGAQANDSLLGGSPGATPPAPGTPGTPGTTDASPAPGTTPPPPTPSAIDKSLGGLY
ncbi:penicillin-binding protein 1A [Acidocella aquatica]|uniref:Penicillin-binding protein 1A n=1 Tax=Acidocella aquatica TaxID=1922313 RepID=A0ABQ6AE79_9PROT|nr:PBP1A family penicillin-binding protein [Acidocella aquatica]GLR68523.1 penicillin-binding protein 1A [Acidocella aquatica]